METPETKQSKPEKVKTTPSVRSNADKKDILTHYTERIAKLVEKTFSPSKAAHDNTEAEITFLRNEISWRLDSWLKVPDLEGNSPQLLGVLSGFLLEELDRLRTLESTDGEAVNEPSPSAEVYKPRFPSNNKEKIDLIRVTLFGMPTQDRKEEFLMDIMERIRDQFKNWLSLPLYDLKMSITANYILFKDFLRNEIVILEVLDVPSEIVQIPKCPSDAEKIEILKDVLLKMPDYNAIDPLLISEMARIKKQIGGWLVLPRYQKDISTRMNYLEFKNCIVNVLESIEKRNVKPVLCANLASDKKMVKTLKNILSKMPHENSSDEVLLAEMIRIQNFSDGRLNLPSPYGFGGPLANYICFKTAIVAIIDKLEQRIAKHK